MRCQRGGANPPRCNVYSWVVRIKKNSNKIAGVPCTPTCPSSLRRVGDDVSATGDAGYAGWVTGDIIVTRPDPGYHPTP